MRFLFKVGDVFFSQEFLAHQLAADGERVLTEVRSFRPREATFCSFDFSTAEHSIQSDPLIGQQLSSWAVSTWVVWFEFLMLGESTKFSVDVPVTSLDECIRIPTNMTFVLNVYLVNHLRFASTIFLFCAADSAECKFVSLQRARKTSTLGVFPKETAKKEEPCNRRLGVVGRDLILSAVSRCLMPSLLQLIFENNGWVSNEGFSGKQSLENTYCNGFKNKTTIFQYAGRGIPAPAPRKSDTQNIGHQYQAGRPGLEGVNMSQLLFFSWLPLVALVFLERFLLGTSALLESGSESLAFEPRG